jgi:hypothetical protein
MTPQLELRCALCFKPVLGVLALCLAAILDSAAATVWNGPVMTFSQTSTDPSQAINQDRITANVWLTRGSSRGLFNIAKETSFANNFSPADTEWADGTPFQSCFACVRQLE